MSSTKGHRLGERVRGRSNYVRFNVEGFPDDWHLTVNRIIGEGSHAASWIEFTNADRTVQPGICFFDLQRDGTIIDTSPTFGQIRMSYRLIVRTWLSVTDVADLLICREGHCSPGEGHLPPAYWVTPAPQVH